MSAAMVLVPVEPTPEMLDKGAMEVAMNQQRVMTAERKAEHIYRAMLSAAPKPGAGWVSVEERLPETCYEDVLVYPRPTDYCCEAHWTGKGWRYGEHEHYSGHVTHPCNVTHWQPMPAAPAPTQEQKA